jgi:hypothetical protein
LIPRLKQLFGVADDAPPAGVPQARILMVCTGNICRSPTAEGVLRAKLQQAGLHTAFAVDSAGTQGYHTAEPPDPRAVRAAAARGYDISRLEPAPCGRTTSRATPGCLPWTAATWTGCASGSRRARRRNVPC